MEYLLPGEHRRDVFSKAIDFPMARERYLSTWKIFRSISDENVVTSKHILDLDCWKQVRSFADFGCGDGLIAKELILNSGAAIKLVRLVDPDEEMLTEAFRRLTETKLAERVDKFNCMFEDVYPMVARGVDAIVAVHLVYLIKQESLHLLINQLPLNTPLVVVLDDEDSVFTDLWKRTAPRYAERSEHAREFLNSLDERYNVRKSTIVSSLNNPLTERDEVRDALISIISYHDYKLMDQELRSIVEELISARAKNGRLECSSVCYEVIREQ